MRRHPLFMAPSITAITARDTTVVVGGDVGNDRAISNARSSNVAAATPPSLGIAILFLCLHWCGSKVSDYSQSYFVWTDQYQLDDLLKRDIIEGNAAR
jgi:hypothetical protein